MATITGLTAARMLAIEAATVVSGAYDSAGHLILTKFDATQVDAGPVPSASETAKGVVELATEAETVALADNSRAITPSSIASTINGFATNISDHDIRLDDLEAVRVQILASNALAETDLPSIYPDGISLMPLTTSSGWSLNSGFGSVVTDNVEGDHISQTFFTNAGGTDAPRMWIRQHHSTDGGGGWTDWSQVQTLYTLTPGSFTQSTAFTSYPQGTSRIYYTSANSTSWDFSGEDGEVMTFVDGSDFARQTFTQHEGGSALPGVWVRTANSANGWTDWRKAVFEDRTNNDVGLPTAMASGTVTITPVADTPTSLGISFPAGRFSSAPNVQVTARTTVPGASVIEVGYSNSSATGCDIYVYRVNTVDTIIDWLATEF